MYQQPKKAHCEGCPGSTAVDPSNPHVCIWEKIDFFPSGRQRVIKIVQRLMRNNEHPWCGFDEHFRLIVVRAAVRAVMKISHGNEEHYHDSENQPANFRRRRAGQIEEEHDHRSSQDHGRASVQHLETDEARSQPIPPTPEGETMNVRTRENFDLDFMKNPNRWPMQVVLPVKRVRHALDDPLEHGVMLPGSSDVLLAKLADYLALPTEKRLTVPRLKYATPEDALAAGWIVD